MRLLSSAGWQLMSHLFCGVGSMRTCMRLRPKHRRSRLLQIQASASSEPRALDDEAQPLRSEVRDRRHGTPCRMLSPLDEGAGRMSGSLMTTISSLAQSVVGSLLRRDKPSANERPRAPRGVFAPLYAATQNDGLYHQEHQGDVGTAGASRDGG